MTLLVMFIWKQHIEYTSCMHQVWVKKHGIARVQCIFYLRDKGVEKKWDCLEVTKFFIRSTPNNKACDIDNDINVLPLMNGCTLWPILKSKSKIYLNIMFLNRVKLGCKELMACRINRHLAATPSIESLCFLLLVAVNRDTDL